MAAPTNEQSENLVYVLDMIQQLKTVSGAANGSLLAHLMDMVRLEVEREIAGRSITSREQ